MRSLNDKMTFMTFTTTPQKKLHDERVPLLGVSGWGGGDDDGGVSVARVSG